MALTHAARPPDPSWSPPPRGEVVERKEYGEAPVTPIDFPAVFTNGDVRA